MNGTVVIAVALCVVSALGYAVGALVQQRVGDLPVRELMRTPRWWLAMGSNGLGAVLHVAALRFGPLVLVQALGVLTLVLAVPLAAAAGRHRIARRQGLATLLAAAGLTGLLAFCGPAAGTALTSQDLVVLVLAAAATLTLAAMHAQGLTAAAAGGIAFGVASAVTQTLTVRPSTVLLTGTAIVALNVAGVLFTQRSYRRGLAAPLAVGTVANPVAAAVIGVVLLGERFQGGVAPVVACAAAIIAGVWLLTRSQAPVTGYRAHVVRARRSVRRRRVITRPAGRGARVTPEPLPH